ncbi:hypothetical protein Snoj_25900 [Streptomyces nojiriensis]|uniref:Uncharacterized protein n=1 Tax=Streptomyces nojiriensis TaxID=66374 RepID=A0ABQ3SL32_9ACTN|nr:hypothetical protein JYK04_08136 [Streptomyces nojiriensis]GGS29496.1 hypothetical protein GCM10010205_69500 [Streptomyces nojiriensis]GHI68672.1 hypothetical protein Snoj_25900 [Streptomyces nojiriensis]
MHVEADRLNTPSERPSSQAQPTPCAVALPATLSRFATHLEMHRGLVLARPGETAAGTAHAHARAALDALPPEKHSLTLGLPVREVEQSRVSV